ncbi:alcohol dehydrogenase GroES domain protein [Fibrella aestuarina BUZ 2]|uniref:Alcohol dehydrogenase GroES domain protein n=1 Tax=Fibrella aestuarina BUZ 2 TaxID=1166018 RepID=I0K7K9_9BACT|nr:NAD(P)-dependent alcohol dehydrogenase [Fibrella aestuarina]CCH00112.1 alcohol dehydrogenase GroES domain protein [Fibrella aestuarina BUZ 2]
MRQVMYSQFGDESVLQLTEQAVPSIEKDQLLIRVKAVSINPLDWKVYGGEMTLMSGSKFPKSVGIDFAGLVEQTGSAITQYTVGDPVMGLLDAFKGGALADYIVVKATDVAPKPANTSFEQAAALPVTGLSAIQIIDQLAAVKANQEVLINGATGGVGVFAVQIAKKRGARVTAVVSTKGVAAVTAWGADTVIDYTKQRLDQLNQRFDVVIDLSTKLPFAEAKRLMKPRAVFVSTLPSPVSLLSSFVNNLFSGKKHKILILKPTATGFSTLTKLAEDGLQIVLDKTYALANVQEAYREARRGKGIGKSVIVMD